MLDLRKPVVLTDKEMACICGFVDINEFDQVFPVYANQKTLVLNELKKVVGGVNAFKNAANQSVLGSYTDIDGQRRSKRLVNNRSK